MGAENARLQLEAGQNFVAMAELTNTGDNKIFATASSPWSRANGKTPVIRPNGVRSGGAVIPKTGTDNTVTVAALEANIGGAIVSVASGDLAATRTAAGGVFQITSLTVTSAGALAAVPGTEGAAFVETRGAAGGPPYIPVGSIEIGQVRLTSNTDADVTEAEIKTIPGVHVELYNSVLWTENYYRGRVEFVDTLPLIHTGDVPKKVYAEYYTPAFTSVPHANNIVLPEQTASVTSEQDYDGVSNSVSLALGQAAYSVGQMQDGFSDLVAQMKGQILWHKFFPDRYKSFPYSLFQGYLAIARSFPASGGITAACTVSAESAATEVLT